MGKIDRSTRKSSYFEKLLSLLKTYPKVLIVVADHVGSKQMSDIRVSLRGKAILLMGKNTTIRTAMRSILSEMPQLEKLLDCVKLNIGFVFCLVDPSEVRKTILENKVPAPAKAAVIAPTDVFIPAGPTGMDPGSTSFFQALGIATKIAKGQIEIQNEVHLVKKDEKVSASAATLLQKLNIRPFSYGLKVTQVYDDGCTYDASVLDLGDDVIIGKFREGVANVAAMSRGLNIPTQASAPHCILEAFKFATAFVLDTDYEFEQMKMMKEMLKNPGAFAAVAAPATGGAEGGAKGGAPAKEEVKEEEEEDEDLGFSLFD